MKTSESIKELAAALAKAQAEIKGAAKTGENPHFRSRYADLASTWDACRDALTKHGLSIVQSPGGDDPEIVRMTTRLLHESGEWIEDTLAMRPVKSDPQGIGSATTYARRYALAAMAGVAPEDDDGNAASHQEKTAPPPKVTAKQAADIEALRDEVGLDEKKFLDWLKVDTISNLPAADFRRVIRSLEKRRKATPEAA